MRKIEIIGIKLPEVKVGDRIAELILEELNREGIPLKDGDVVVITSKVVSKAKGYLEKISNMKISLKSKIIARITGKPSWLVEVIRRHSCKIVATVEISDIVGEVVSKCAISKYNGLKLVKRDKSILLTKMPFKLVLSDGGIDQSNVAPGYVSYLPPDPDVEARSIKEELESLTGKRVAVVITDTEVSISKLGSVDVAIGSSGIDPVDRRFAESDLYGKPKFGGMDIVVDEVAAAAALIMKQGAQGYPVVIVRGLEYKARDDVGVKDIALSDSIVKRKVLSVVIRNAFLKFFRLL